MARFPLPKNSEPARLLTVREVAQLDNVSVKTVRRAIEAGLLEVLRIGPNGHSLRIEPAAHAAYRRACRG